MTAYYNENDRFAAAWLRELIKENLIAPGEVDERSIEEVKAEDLRGFTQHHFFAGIGVWSYALRKAGWPDDIPVWTGSCPCQSFSASGKRTGFSGKRHHWPTWFRLVEEYCPNTLFGEQVASKDGLAWFDVVSSELERAGYTVGAADLPACGFGAPHIRNRIFFVAHSDGGNQSYRGIQRGGEYGQQSENSGTVSMADSQHDAGRADQPQRQSEKRKANGRPRGLANPATPRLCGREDRRTDCSSPEENRWCGSGESERSGENHELGDSESGRRGKRRRAEGAGSERHADITEQTHRVGISSDSRLTRGRTQNITSRLRERDACIWINSRTKFRI